MSFAGDIVSGIGDILSGPIGLGQDLVEFVGGGLGDLGGAVGDVVGDVGGFVGDVAGGVGDVAGDVLKGIGSLGNTLAFGGGGVSPLALAGLAAAPFTGGLSLTAGLPSWAIPAGLGALGGGMLGGDLESALLGGLAGGGLGALGAGGTAALTAAPTAAGAVPVAAQGVGSLAPAAAGAAGLAPTAGAIAPAAAAAGVPAAAAAGAGGGGGFGLGSLFTPSNILSGLSAGGGLLQAAQIRNQQRALEGLAVDPSFGGPAAEEAFQRLESGDVVPPGFEDYIRIVERGAARAAARGGRPREQAIIEARAKLYPEFARYWTNVAQTSSPAGRMSVRAGATGAPLQATQAIFRGFGTPLEQAAEDARTNRLIDALRR